MTVETSVEAEGDILRLRLSGKLTAADYQQFVPLVDRQIAERERVHLLIELRDFHGWTAGALWHDLKFTVSHFSKIHRIAVQGERPWQKGLTMFLRPFTMARVRYFPDDQEGPALDWLREDTGRPPSGQVYDWNTAPPAIAELLHAMDGRDGTAREKARQQIVTVGAPAVPHLIQAAHGGHWQLRLEATRALASIAEPNSAEALARQFDDSPEIGWAAAEGLKHMGVPGARAALQQLLQHPSSHGVRVSAHHALREQQAPAVRAAILPVVQALEDSAPASEAPVAAFAALQKLA